MWGSSKPKEREYSGKVGDLSADQEKCFQQFQEWVEAGETNLNKRYDEYDYLRFCRARKFVIADVQLMWTNYINFRKEKDVDTITQTFDFHERDKVAEIYPQFYHKTDRTGRPLYIERLGGMNVPALWAVTTEERMFQSFYYGFELLFKWRYPSASAVAGRRIDTSLSIMDMTNFSASMMNSQVRAILKAAAKITSDNYPENMGAMYVVNAPFVFSACWSMVKGFMDEKTVAKIKILGGSY